MRRFALTIVGLALLGATGAPAAVVEKALASLEASLETAPRDAGLLTDYANLLVRAGRTDQALASYRLALEVEPKSKLALYNLGLLELELGHLRKAGRLLRQSLAIDRSFARGHYALGMVLAQRRQNLRAVQRYSTAFSLDPDLVDPDLNPELLFNDLATWASMHSYLTTSVERGTRMYSNPQPIVGLLIDGLEAPAEPQPVERKPAAPNPPEPAKTQPAAAAADDGN